MQLDYLGLTCYSWHYATHVSLFRHLATLLRHKWRSCTARSSHVDTPSPGAHMSNGGPATSVLAPELVTRFPPKGIRAYGTRHGYMNHDSGYVAGSLKEPGRRATTGLLSFLWDVVVPWVFPNQGIASLGVSRALRPVPNSRFPFETSIGVDVRAVLPASIEGCS